VDKMAWGGRRVRAYLGIFLMLAGMAILVDSGPARAGGSGYGGRAPQRLGVPAYWPAATPDGAAAFDRLVDAASTVDTVIVNGAASGPADPFDPALAAAIARLADEGVTVLGYVDSGYLGRSGAATTRVNPGSTAMSDWQAQAVRDSRTWYRLYGAYGLGGIFLDQTLATCGDGHEYVDAYGEVTGAVWRRNPDAMIAINPGVSVEECYTDVTDVIVMAENTLEGYRSWTPPAWVYDHPASTFWHLVHATPTAEHMIEVVTLAHQRNGGYVFVTDAVIDPAGGPWNALPAQPYWSAQLAAVEANRGDCRRVRG
jgi:hypothetical protein